MTFRTHYIATESGMQAVRGEGFELKIDNHNFKFFVHEAPEQSGLYAITHERSGMRLTTIPGQRLTAYRGDRVLAARITLAEFVDRKKPKIVAEKLREKEQA